jgi:hypothetical protein
MFYWKINLKNRSLVSCRTRRSGAIHDARIAAICRFHGVRELWSAQMTRRDGELYSRMTCSFLRLSASFIR